MSLFLFLSLSLTRADSHREIGRVSADQSEDRRCLLTLRSIGRLTDHIRLTDTFVYVFGMSSRSVSRSETYLSARDLYSIPPSSITIPRLVCYANKSGYSPTYVSATCSVTVIRANRRQWFKTRTAEAALQKTTRNQWGEGSVVPGQIIDHDVRECMWCTIAQEMRASDRTNE